MIRSILSGMSFSSLHDYVFMCGGGNIIRGRNIKNQRIHADQIGIMSTAINSMVLSSIFEEFSIPTSVLSSKPLLDLEIYSPSRALSLSKSSIVILCGGLGCGYISTDMAMMVRSLELGCNPVKLTQIGAVHDKDPREFENTKILDNVTYDLAMNLSILDTSAVALARANNATIKISSLEGFFQKGTVPNAGTTIS